MSCPRTRLCCPSASFTSVSRELRPTFRFSEIRDPAADLELQTSKRFISVQLMFESDIKTYRLLFLKSHRTLETSHLCCR